MTVIAPTTPYGYTIFCDDLRQEANGKLIYIGVYTADMIIFGTPPMLLPTFVAAITYRERPGESDVPVKIKMFLPGSDAAAAELDLPVAVMRSAQFGAETEGEDRIYSAFVSIRASPLLVRQGGLIKMRAYRGDDEIRLGALAVKFQAPLGTLPT
ncbi:MAG: hypothetical protein WBF43_02615 [Methylocella sp.]